MPTISQSDATLCDVTNKMHLRILMVQDREFTLDCYCVGLSRWPLFLKSDSPREERSVPPLNSQVSQVLNILAARWVKLPAMRGSGAVGHWVVGSSQHCFGRGRGLEEATGGCVDRGGMIEFTALSNQARRP